MKQYQKFEQALANTAKEHAAKISGDIPTFEYTALRFDSMIGLCAQFYNRSKPSLLERLIELLIMDIDAAKWSVVCSSIYIDVAGEYQQNGKSVRSDCLVNVPCLNDVQVETCFKIDPIDFDFTDVAYGAWKPRIV